MIPKVIHYCWLSGDPFPREIRRCIDSWKKLLPDYELRLWSKDNFDIDSVPWVRDAYNARKYAFAADYIRFWAVYTYGGIYLDSDVLVKKPFDDLLDLPYFIGSEGLGNIEAAIFGAPKGAEWLKPCIDFYVDRPFYKEDGSLNTVTAPRVMMQQISPLMEVRMCDRLDRDEIVNTSGHVLCVLPKDYFCCKSNRDGMVMTTENTYCVHNFSMSWLPRSIQMRVRIKIFLIRIFGEKCIYSIINKISKKF